METDTDQNRHSFVVLPDGAPEELRRKFGVGSCEKLRLSYLSTADDAARVQRLWAENTPDPRSIRPAHATMFFELVEKLGAEGLMFSGHGTEPLVGQSVQIERITKAPGFAPRSELLAMIVDMEERLAQFDPHAVILAQSLPEWAWPRFSRRFPALMFHNSLLWPLPWDEGGNGLMAALKKGRGKSRAKRNFKHVRGVVSGGEKMLAQAQSVLPTGIPFGFDIPQMLEPFRYARRSSVRKLMCFGQVREDNGVFDLVCTVRELQADVPELQLQVVGFGPDTEALNNEVKELPGISFEGLIGNVRFCELIGETDLCVACLGVGDWQEPLAELYAAGLSGVPSLISSNTPIFEFQRETCLSVPASDPAALRTAVRNLVLDDEAFQKLTARLPLSDEANFDRSRSFGSEIGRLLLEMVV